MLAYARRFLQQGGSSDSPLNSHPGLPQTQAEPVNQSSPISGFNFHFDTASFLGWVEDLDIIVQKFCFGHPVVVESIDRKLGSHHFVQMTSNPSLGFYLSSYLDENLGKYFYRLELKGVYFSRVSFLDTLGLFSFLQTSTRLKKCSRLDAALDDYRKIVSIDQLLKNTEHLTGFRNTQLIQSGGLDGFDSQTLYFGKGGKKNGSKKSNKGSDKQLRIYNTNQTHDFDAVRFELQLRDKYADRYFKAILSDFNNLDNSDPDFDDRLAKSCINYLLGSFDFIKKKDKNLPRGTRCRFWSKFLKILEATPIKIRLPKVEWVVERSMNWLYRQVSKTLFSIKSALGGLVDDKKFNKLVNLITDSAGKNFDEKDQLKVEAFKEYFGGLDYG